MNGFSIFDNLGYTAFGVIEAVLPLLAIFAVLQGFYLKLLRSYIITLSKGILISSVGLLLFLQGVQSGFLPFGKAIGQALGNSSIIWMAIPLGFLLGFFTAWGEPAVRVLCSQVEKASSGTIRKITVLCAICIGVAFIVALGIARVIYTIPLLYIVVPGYAIAIVMLWLTEKDFIGIAFDAGGCATGPIANTFLLSLGIGLSSVNDAQNPLIYGFGLAALIALAPIMSVMALGIFVRVRTHYRREN
ncbi:MAG: DUF1538 domain-containing protein [Dehalococcoidales bacterium]|nr:DUF1538 domain-containing protein [Dehalococcoidales bacterium]